MRKLLIISLFLIFAFSSSYAGWNDNVTLHGYFRETPILWKPQDLTTFQPESEYRFTNLLHFRQNFRWFASGNLTMGLELKERSYLGRDAGLMMRAAYYEARPAYFDWSENFVEENSIVVQGIIDRLWMDAVWRSAELILGRQRIAWGTNLVWNPTDIFNPSSPLDYDNQEKPGTDAARLQVYMGSNSLVEIAVAPAREADSTIAAMRVKVNRWNYDWIAVGGRRAARTFAGFSWAGSLKGGGFRGEFIYFVPRSPQAGLPNGYLDWSVSGDYTFANGLYAQGALLYSRRGTTGKAGGGRLLRAVQDGELTPGRLSVLGQLSRDLSPLWRGDLVGIMNPYDKSFYVGPDLRWSALANLDLTFMGLVFGGDKGTEFGDDSRMLMLWAKYSY
jgi:hypothetical protein